MLKIKFRSMLLTDDFPKGTLVEIEGDCKEQKITIKMSILQLAKVFGCDKKVLDEMEEKHFGSHELEEKCEEVKDVIINFPDVKKENNKIICDEVNFENPRNNVRMNVNKKTVTFYSENICGWNNEGIEIEMPISLFEKELDGKKFKFILKEDSLELIKNK